MLEEKDRKCGETKGLTYCTENGPAGNRTGDSLIRACVICHKLPFGYWAMFCHLVFAIMCMCVVVYLSQYLHTGREVLACRWVSQCVLTHKRHHLVEGTHPNILHGRVLLCLVHIHQSPEDTTTFICTAVPSETLSDEYISSTLGTGSIYTDVIKFSVCTAALARL